jgi:hypothetical protein
MGIFQFSILDGHDTVATMIGGSPQLVGHIAVQMEENGGKLLHTATFDEAVMSLVLKEQDWILVDIDSLGGIVRIFDRLRDLRDAFPSIPLILLSREFDRHEFGIHRLALGDVSLSVPFTVQAFELGLLQARTNNLAWQARAASTVAAASPVCPALSVVAGRNRAQAPMPARLATVTPAPQFEKAGVARTQAPRPTEIHRQTRPFPKPLRSFFRFLQRQPA